MSASGNMPWYHGPIPRLECERLLSENGQDGAYLVRSSETIKGAYVLSVMFQRKIVHYRIVPDESSMLYLQANRQSGVRSFSNLSDLVSHYQSGKHGLCSQLVNPIEPPRDDLDADEDSDDECDDGDVEESVTEGSSSKNNSMVATFLTHSLDSAPTEGTNQDFKDKVGDYLRFGAIKDVEEIQYDGSLVHLNLLLKGSYSELQRQVRAVKSQTNLLQAVFDKASGSKELCDGGAAKKQVSFDSKSLPDKLRDLAGSIESLEKTAAMVYRDLAVHVLGARGVQSRTASISVAARHVSRPPALLPKEGAKDSKKVMDEYTFDVAVDGGLQTSKRVFKIIMAESRLLIFKPADEHSSQVYEHHQVKQLIKSRSKERKLGIIFDGQGRRDYLFETLSARERFCQIIQLVKKKNQRQDDGENKVTLFIGTFNMGDSPPPPELDSWFLSQGWGATLSDSENEPHDIYAIGIQESGWNDKDVVVRVKNILKRLHGMDFEKVAFKELWFMKVVVLVKPEHRNRISHVQTDSVKTGIGNTLGNKGAMGISFTFDTTSLCFINCHLTSGVEKLNRRNQNYHDILRGLANLKQGQQIRTFDLTHQFHHLFWFGDLNYRIDMTGPRIVELAKSSEFVELLLEDQLQKEQKSGRAFVGFHEHDIKFPPTYRFKKNTRTLDDYVWIKQKSGGRTRINVPSYCDRVLWKSYPGTRIECLAYGCTNNVMTSDHSPVFAVFSLSNVATYIPAATSTLAQKAEIKFDSCQCDIQTNSRTQFYLEFYSDCFEGVHRSLNNSLWSDSVSGNTVRPAWNASELPKAISPVISDSKYLEMQHILVSVKSSTSDESYAECCLSLGNFINAPPVPYVCPLTHQGQAVGNMEIKCHVDIPGMEKANKTSADYADVVGDFIYTELDSMSLPKLPPQPVSPIPGVASHLPINGSANKSKPPVIQARRSLENRSTSFTESYSEGPPLPMKTRNTVGSPVPVPRTPPLPTKPKLLAPPKPAPRNSPTSVQDLLTMNGMEDYSYSLVDNGYDDLRFIHETTEEELADIGVDSQQDREKLLRIFQDYHNTSHQ